jgi:hypothetical protein
MDCRVKPGNDEEKDKEDVDGRDEPGHDHFEAALSCHTEHRYMLR